jgi:hypothetical protein
VIFSEVASAILRCLRWLVAIALSVFTLARQQDESNLKPPAPLIPIAASSEELRQLLASDPRAGH